MVRFGTHMNEIIPVVCMVVFKDNYVLLVRHTNSKHVEGIYGLPGG